MKFGIFYELQLPRPWDRDSEWQLYHNTLAELELADGLGYEEIDTEQFTQRYGAKAVSVAAKVV